MLGPIGGLFVIYQARNSPGKIDPNHDQVQTSDVGDDVDETLEISKSSSSPSRFPIALPVSYCKINCVLSTNTRPNP